MRLGNIVNYKKMTFNAIQAIYVTFRISLYMMGL